MLAAVAAACGGTTAATSSSPRATQRVSDQRARQLLMRAAVLSPDGTRALRAHGSAPAADARRLGQDLAAELLRRGASAFISSPSSGNDVQ